MATTESTPGGLRSILCLAWEPLRRTFDSRRSLGLLEALLASLPAAGPIAGSLQLLRQKQACSPSAEHVEHLLREACTEVAARSAEAAKARQQAAAAEAHKAVLRQEIVRRELVIQHLSRQRDDAAAEALCRWRQLWEAAVQRSARSVAALAAVRLRYEEMMQSLRETMLQLEAETEQEHCTRCGSRRTLEPVLRVFAAAGRVAEVRAEALHWREQAEDTWLELQACKGRMQELQMDACTEVASLERRCDHASTAAQAQRERAARAEAALARERLEHAATQQKLQQQRATARRLDSCRSFVQRVQSKNEALGYGTGGSIAAFWVAFG